MESLMGERMVAIAVFMVEEYVGERTLRKLIR